MLVAIIIQSSNKGHISWFHIEYAKGLFSADSMITEYYKYQTLSMVYLYVEEMPRNVASK